MTERRGMEILDDPIHGIFIPSGIFTLGVLVIAWSAGNAWYLLGILALAMFVGARLLLAYRSRTSILPNEWTPLELEERIVLSKNAAIYRFKLRSSVETLDIPTGFHLAAKVMLDGVEEVRYYTPISNKFAEGHFDIIVKSYVDGKVSKWFAGLQPGQTVEFKGPVGRFSYVTNAYKKIGMVTGGSAITPMLSVLNKIVTTPEDTTQVCLIYANETENDILLKDELDDLASKYPNFEVHYVVRKPSASWTGEVGYVTKQHLEKYLPPCNPAHRLLICGPPKMKQMVLEYAEQLGWPKGAMKSKPEDQVFVF
ncbi:AFR439Cp [Eremothecium gossypii ATCC 10895]|uniref:NADH-cytochrome b5 reductase n=1 Tax=Eremothecium gossypii (strain ATCC 10895 / CBS 109.51 / FGSC 9923 / NRRL Y-1056) TaxID=284811 RepID=Q752Y4_EREGS|nr:AFR439Cp [Eremothecium gossypii ATCC 10895]AAS53810.1 AFR439Cp [Eremothecium gossypii ATCC 10895]